MAKEFDNPGPLYTKPNAHAEDEEMAKDGQRKPKWPRNFAEDDPFLDNSDSRRKERRAIEDSLLERPKKKGQVQ